MIKQLKNGVSFIMPGRSGNVYYKESDKLADFYVEMAASSSKYGVLIWFEETTHWTVPENELINEEYRKNIKQQIIKELDRRNVKSDIFGQK